MSTLNNSLKIKFRGKEYKIDFDFSQIMELDEQINVSMFHGRYARNDIRYSHAAQFLACTLNLAGANVTGEEVYKEMFSDKGVDIKDVRELCGEIIGTMYANLYGEDASAEEVEEAQKKS